MWRPVNGLADSSVRTSYEAWDLEHDFLSELVQIAIYADQLDVSNLQTFERVVQKLQVGGEIQRLKWEEKRQDVGAGASALTCEYFSRRARMAGGAIVSPLLITYGS